MVRATDVVLFLISLAGLASLWFSGTHFMGIHVPPLMAALGSYVALTMLLTRPRICMSPTIKLLLQISLSLVAWMFIANLLSGTSLGQTLHVVGGKVFIGVIIAFCVWYSANSVNKLRYLIYVLIAGVAISAFVGIGQYLVGEPFISIWAKTGGNLGRMWEIQRKVVIAGLAGYSVPFGYQLCAAIPLTFALLLSVKSRLGKMWWLSLLSLLGIAVVLSVQRSATIASMAGIILITWFYLSRYRLLYTSLGVSFGTIVYFSAGLYFSKKFVVLSTASTLARIPLWITALLVGLYHPLGTGVAGYMEAARAVYGMVSHLPASQYALELTSHNQFLNILGYYGFPGLFLLLIFYFLLFKILIHAYKRAPKGTFVHNAGLGLLGASVAYVVNSLFHNAGPFIGDLVNWYYIGLILALDKVSRRYDGESIQGVKGGAG